MKEVDLKCRKCEQVNSSYNWTEATKKYVQSVSSVKYHVNEKTVESKYMFICPGCNEWIDGENILIDNG